jgi:hypothetical protein
MDFRAVSYLSCRILSDRVSDPYPDPHGSALI